MTTTTMMMRTQTSASCSFLTDARRKKYLHTADLSNKTRAGRRQGWTEENDDEEEEEESESQTQLFKSVQEIDERAMIDQTEIAYLIDRDPKILKEYEKLKTRAREISKYTVEKMEIANKQELIDQFEKTTKRVNLQQSEAERAAMEEMQMREIMLREAEENMRRVEKDFRASEANEERTNKKDEDRIESAKVAIISALAGVFLALPLALTQMDGFVNQVADCSTIAISSALFGIVYRYACRENAFDLQLKGGVVAAFGLVRGLAEAEVFVLNSLPSSSSSQAIPSVATTFAEAALIVGESVLIFFFSALCVEAATQRNFVKRKSGLDDE